MYYLIQLALCLVPIPIALGSLTAAATLGRAAPGDEARRARRAVSTAVCLSILASPTPFLLFVGFGLLIVPAIAFGIAAAVAGQAGRRPLLFGGLACPWFPLPLMLYWQIFPPLEIMRFAGLPPPSEGSYNGAALVLLWFSWWGVGLLGAGAAALILRSRRTPPCGGKRPA